MAKGRLRSIEITKLVDGNFHMLEWRYGDEPRVTTTTRTRDKLDNIQIAPPDAIKTELIALAERIAEAAGRVLVKSPLQHTDLKYGERLSGGCWWTVMGAPNFSEFKPETLAKIAREAGL